MERAYRNGAFGHDDVDTGVDQRHRQFLQPDHIAVAPLRDQDEIAPLHVAMPGQPAQERPELALRRWPSSQVADAPHPLGLLRPRGERPSGSSADKRDEVASLHSITSSARASSVGGTSRPSALAVLRLIASSYLVGACTGKSAGFSPFRIRST